MDDRTLAHVKTTLDLFHAENVVAAERAVHAGDYPDGFFQWLDMNQHIWTAFVERAQAVRRAGHKRFAARTIVENIRWHTLLADVGSKFKINDHYTPGLARLAMAVHPELRGMFELRVQRGEHA